MALRKARKIECEGVGLGVAADIKQGQALGKRMVEARQMCRDVAPICGRGAGHRANVAEAVEAEGLGGFCHSLVGEDLVPRG